MKKTVKRVINKDKKINRLTALLIILAVAAVGTYLLVVGRAASPYSSSLASNGTVAGGATIQTCSGSSSGNCVQFGSTTGNGGIGATPIGVGNNMAVAVQFDSPSSSGVATTATSLVKYIRMNFDDSNAANQSGYFLNNGSKIDALFYGSSGGSYDSNGIADMIKNQTDADNWANHAYTIYNQYCTPTTCPILEILNEPAVFWGSNDTSCTTSGGSFDDCHWQAAKCSISTTACPNQRAYDMLLRAVYNKFCQPDGSGKCTRARPNLLASYDGGSSGYTNWGEGWWAADSSISNYIDGITMHPYSKGGLTYSINSPNDCTSVAADGNRCNVRVAEKQTNKPIYITEVGWPTDTAAGPTGDSLQWSEHDQCNNVYNFLGWARSTNYIHFVSIFSHNDYGPNNWYGVYRDFAGSSAKPSANGLKAAANLQANPC